MLVKSVAPASGDGQSRSLGVTEPHRHGLKELTGFS